MIKTQGARILRAMAQRLEPERACQHSCSVCSSYQMTKALADLISGQIVGSGVAGRAFKPGSGTDYSY